MGEYPSCADVISSQLSSPAHDIGRSFFSMLLYSNEMNITEFVGTRGYALNSVAMLATTCNGGSSNSPTLCISCGHACTHSYEMQTCLFDTEKCTCVLIALGIVLGNLGQLPYAHTVSGLDVNVSGEA